MGGDAGANTAEEERVSADAAATGADASYISYFPRRALAIGWDRAVLEGSARYRAAVCVSCGGVSVGRILTGDGSGENVARGAGCETRRAGIDVFIKSVGFGTREEHITGSATELGV